MKKNTIRLFFSFLFLAFLFSACTKNSETDKRIYLDSGWQYSLHGEPYPFYDFPAEDLNNLSSFIDDRIGHIFIKTKFKIPSYFKHKDAALYLGRIKIASKVYINNHLIGKTGSFPPHEFTEGNKSFALQIPSEYLNYDGENTIMICLWCHAYGSIESMPFISVYSDVEHEADYDTLIYSKLYLIFTVILFIISLIYFFLYVLRRSETENLTFSLLCLFTGIYLCTFYYGEYSFLGRDYISYLLFEKIFKGACALITGYLIVCFTRDFLHYKESLKSKLIRLFITFGATVFPFTAGNIPDFRNRLRIGFLFIILQFFFEFKIIYISFRKKDKRLKYFFICIIPFLLAFSSQIIFKIAIHQKIDTLLLAISWITVIFLFLGILIINFVQLANKVEFMNKNLEKLVEERTTALEHEKERAIKEIELASFVQQNFLKINSDIIENWELRYFSKPMAGVSGDMYMAFNPENKFDGIGIFDVSGHGIASGLVTMLVKNIIEQEFYRGLNKPLNEVMHLINERIITEKGNIENYLTGMLIRNKGSYMELVNAGHPKALLYNSTTQELNFIEQENINQYGTIGIDGFPVSFETITFKMNSGDEIILYTDGITEAEDAEKNEFGTQGIINMFNKYKDKSVYEQVMAIHKELSDFTGSEQFNDDITYIILKKK